MEALGRLFDIAVGQVPIDLAAANGSTGKRVDLKNAGGVAFVVFVDAGTNGEDIDLDVQEHNASSGGTTQDLDVVTKFYRKRGAATLAGTEAWVKGSQTAASEVDLGTDEGENEGIYVVEVSAAQLSAGFRWVSLNVTDPGATAGKLGAVLYVLYDLAVQRKPENLAATL